MPDVRSPDQPGTARVVRPGQRMGPKQWHHSLHRTACSEISAFVVCPQLHGFGYEMNLKAADEKPARKIGTLVHVGLAYRYGAILPQKPDWMVYPDARTALWTIAQGDVEAGTEALRVFDAYQAHYPIEQNYFRPLLVEHELHSILDIDGVKERYTLRIDMVAEDTRDGAVVLIDHKSAYKLTKNTGYGYRADREMLTALALCQANGIQPQRIVINAMTKERPEPKFGRFEVPLSHEAYGRIGPDTVHWIRQIRAMRAAYPDPANRPRAYESCTRKYGICDMWSICSDGPQRIAEFTKKW